MSGTATPNTRRSLHKAARYVFSGQFRQLFHAIGERVPSWLFRSGKARIYEIRDLSDNLTVEARDVDGDEYRIGEVTRDELALCAAVAGLPAAEFFRRYDHGDRCFAAFIGPKPAHITWLHFGSCYIRGLDLLLSLEDTDCYSYGVFTDPNYRGKGLFKRVFSHILLRLAEKGTSCVVGLIMEGNQIPMNVYQKHGFRLTAIIRNVTVCGIHKTVVTDCSSGKSVCQIRCKRPSGVHWI